MIGGKLSGLYDSQGNIKQGMQSKGYRPVGDVQYLGGCDARCLYP
jgi:hypothetical protein